MNTPKQIPLVIAVYLGHKLKPYDLPQEMWNWPVIETWLREQKQLQEQMDALKILLSAGHAHEMRTPAGIAVTLIAVVEGSRAVDDIRRAKLMVAKVQGSA